MVRHLAQIREAGQGCVKERGIFRKRRDPGARRVRQDVFYTLVREHQRNTCPQYLLFEMRGQPERHQLADNDGVDRLPRRNCRFKQPELRSAAATIPPAACTW